MTRRLFDLMRRRGWRRGAVPSEHQLWGQAGCGGVRATPRAAGALALALATGPSTPARAAPAAGSARADSTDAQASSTREASPTSAREAGPDSTHGGSPAATDAGSTPAHQAGPTAPARQAAGSAPDAGDPPPRTAAQPPPADPPRADRASPPAADLAAIYARGEARFAAGDLDGAVAAFARGWTRATTDAHVPPRIQAYFGASLGIALVKRYERDLSAQDGDPKRVGGKDLRRALHVLNQVTSHHREVLAQEPTLEALARRNLERARQLMIQRQPPPPRATGSDPVAARRRAQAQRQRRGGVGLLLAGTATAVAGIAVLVDGLTLRRRALALAEDPPAPNQQQYIDEEVPRLARLRYAIAGPALALGLGLVVGGAVLLGRASRTERGAPKRRRATLSPGLRIHF